MRHALPRTFRSSRSGLRLAGALLAAFLVTGCGGNGGTVPSAPSGNTPQQQQTASVTFTMHWNSSGTSSTVRRPQYVGSALSIGVTINGGIPQYLNAPVTTMAMNAPVGSDTFSFTTYDEPNGGGNVLGTASLSKQIVLGTTNTISAVLNGVVASYALTIANPNPPAGVAVTEQLSLNAFDADGNLIAGTASNYAQSFTLSISDPANTGQLTLSRTSIPSRGTIVTVHYAGGTLLNASVVATAPGLPTTSAVFAPKPTVYEYSVTAGVQPQWIAAGSDGNMWFTEAGSANAVAKITLNGATITPYTIPTANAYPSGIVSGSDGRLWFTETISSKIGAVTTSGTFTERPTLFASDGPFLLVDRGDGNIWYTGNAGDHIGYQGITSGTSGETTIPTANSDPYGIAEGPDLNLYFSESAPGVDKIGRLNNLFGVTGELHLTAGSTPEGVVRGPDGNIWIAESGTSKIARLSPNSFSVTAEFPTVSPNAFPRDIRVGQDGALWFTESGLSRIGRVTTGGVASEYAIPTVNAGLEGLGVAPDGSIWFCETVGKVGKLVY
jgi:virginiamycin B lyase